jgi:LCP family protein required for cell wall assembly
VSRPGIAALLSALLPGLGQVRLGARRRGALIALPFVGLIVILGGAILLDPKGTFHTLLSPGALGGVLVLVIALGVYHVAAVVDAYRLGKRSPRTSFAPTINEKTAASRSPALRSPVLIVALACVVGFYGTIEFVGIRASEAADAIFVDPRTGFEIPKASFSPRPGSTPGGIPSGPVTAPPPTPTAFPGPAWAADGRLNLLLIGSDAGPGRWMARTDTMVVLSVQVASGRAALFGIPRNIVNVPLPPESAAAFPNGRFPQFLNALYVYATNHPNKFPGGEARGFRAVTGAVQELIGVPLDGAIVVNLNGFVDLVDAIGGLWVDLPYGVVDKRYPLPDGTGYIKISIPAGCQKLNGQRALQYARSRHMDSDYGRMQRQQRVLVALAKQLDPMALLPRVPDLLDIAQDNLWTTIQQDEIADLAALAAKVKKGDIQTIRFAPPKYPEYLQTKDIKRIRDRVATVFDKPAAAPTPAPSAKPTATAKPCPRP